MPKPPEGLKDIDYDFSIDLQSIVLNALKQIRVSDIEKFMKFKIYRMINLERRKVQTNESILDAKKASRVKFTFFVCRMRDSKFSDFIRVAKVSLEIYHPLHKTMSCIVIQEPCIIIKILRILALVSSRLS